ncbi:MAG: hypothetical protein QME69_09985 [Candidatus Saccharicenans sp.]|nr:hypothetical protein [Candidatus Saccharicenans sp.]
MKNLEGDSGNKMKVQPERKENCLKVRWKKAFQIALLTLSLTIFIFAVLSISRRLEAKNQSGQAEVIKLRAVEKKEWSGSQLSPLHRIPLNDELNQKIVPAAPDGLPFSSRYSCEPCHSYSALSQGTHFNLKQRPAVDRRAEPWFLVDDKTGVQLPVSFQKYPDFWSPEQLGLSDWKFVTLFGRHLSGGGPGEPQDEFQTPDSRWTVSGKLEINCLGCHHRSPLQDHSEWVKQVMRENFRWAATAASGLGEVVGMASRLPSTWTVADGPNPDDHEWAVVPQVKYNLNLFDSKNNALLDLSRPENERCLACHSISPRKANSRAELERDVHLAAGLRCVDCHRNDLSHEMVRGFEGERLARSSLKSYDYTCAGCHLGQKPEKGGFGWTGKLGAPRPAHKGIPKVHFERLSCTVCHSGLLPEKEPQEVYTARANRLGIFGKAIWTSEYPLLYEPVYVREADRKIYPERIMWPAFWAEKKGKELIPLDSEEVFRVAPEAFSLKQEVAALLNALLPLREGDFYPAACISEFLFEPDANGGLKVRPLRKAVFSGKEARRQVLLVQVRDSEVKPLLPVFDPEEAPPEIEEKIQRTLESLKPLAGGRQPVFLINKYVYGIAEGYLEKKEKEGEPATEPALGFLEGEDFQPLLSSFQVRNLALLGDGPETLTEEQVELALKKISAASPEKEFAYIAGGFLFTLEKGGRLRASEHPAARAITWPLGHNVRPAQQALGKNGCTDCHSPGSKIFFGKVEAGSPLKTLHRESKLSSDLMKTGPLFQFLFGLTFLFRPAFKLVLAGCVLLMGLILLAVVLKLTGRTAGLSGEDSSPQGRS